MGLLSDTELKTRVQNRDLVSDLPGGSCSVQIKAASIDLTIGDIFVPGTKEGEPGSLDKPRREFLLKHGQTVVVRTAENLKLDQDHAGIALPGSSESLRGLLIVNPGHIDPGYSGTLHATLINMGRKEYLLRRGDRLVRCLFFKLDSPAQRRFVSRPDPITPELLSQLSHDFMSINERVEIVAKEEIGKAEARIKGWSIAFPIVATIVIAVLGFVGTIWATNHSIDHRLTRLEVSSPTAKDVEARLEHLEGILPLQQRVDTLEEQTVRDMDVRIKALERSPKK